MPSKWLLLLLPIMITIMIVVPSLCVATITLELAEVVQRCPRPAWWRQTHSVRGVCFTLREVPPRPLTSTLVAAVAAANRLRCVAGLSPVVNIQRRLPMSAHCLSACAVVHCRRCTRCSRGALAPLFVVGVFWR
mgnify:CR=1 FL=1